MKLRGGLRRASRDVNCQLVLGHTVDSHVVPGCFRRGLLSRLVGRGASVFWSCFWLCFRRRLRRATFRGLFLLSGFWRGFGRGFGRLRECYGGQREQRRGRYKDASESERNS